MASMFRLAALAAIVGVVAAFLFRPQLRVGTEPGDPSLPIFDPRTDWTASSHAEPRTA